MTLRALSRWPLVVAPMAGGPSTVDLVVETSRAGALSFLAGGYKTPAALAEEMAAVRAAGVDAFGVNLFVPGAPTADPEGLAAYVALLEADAAVVGAALGEPSWDDDDYAGKVDAVLAAPPAAVSFTFGIPAADVVAALQAAGSAVLLTVTTPEEAVVALRAGPDALCLQGAEAGAHRGSLANDDRPDADRPVRALLAADVHLIGDSGGKAPQWKHIIGAVNVARVLTTMAVPFAQIGAVAEPHEVNGQPGAIIRDRDGKVFATMTLDILGGQIQAIRSVLNPDKLGHVGPVADGWAVMHEAIRARRPAG